MAYYRIYSLDSDQHIIDVDQISANGDADAIGQMNCNDRGFAREIWNLGRMVMAVAPSCVALA